MCLKSLYDFETFILLQFIHISYSKKVTEDSTLHVKILLFLPFEMKIWNLTHKRNIMWWLYNISISPIVENPRSSCPTLVAAWANACSSQVQDAKGEIWLKIANAENFQNQSVKNNALLPPNQRLTVAF